MLDNLLKSLLMAGLVISWAPAHAEDRALIIGNDAPGASKPLAATEANRASKALREAGFAVIDGSNIATSALRSRLNRVLRDLEPADRLVVLLVGPFAHSANQTWYMDAETAEAGEQTFVTIGATALDLTTVLEVAARAPGGAVVLLGQELGDEPALDGLQPGIGALNIPQGVTVVQGSVDQVARFAAFGLSQRGQSISQLLSQAGGLKGSGFLPAGTPFRAALPAGTSPKPPTTVVTPPTAPAVDPAKDEAAWAAANKSISIASMQKYLETYPGGRFAGEARAQLERLRNDPIAVAEAEEAALALNRDQRRTIQRQLTLLGFDTRGIDGILGRGSRGAISAWQKAEGVRATGYLTAAQLPRLAAAADRRAAELEAEAAARQAKLEREDRAYWDTTGAAGDEAGLRAYLKRYPDGIFAELATDRLAVFEEERRAAAARQDRDAWSKAEAGNSIASYQDYLAQFPNGAFAPEAKARIEAQQPGGSGVDEDTRARAEAAEAQLGLNGLTRQLIEERLAGLGFDPGPADGAFDDKTRRAIRRFQNSRNQEVTGYIDQAAIVALLAGGLIKLGE